MKQYNGREGQMCKGDFWKSYVEVCFGGKDCVDAKVTSLLIAALVAITSRYQLTKCRWR